MLSSRLEAALVPDRCASVAADAIESVTSRALDLENFQPVWKCLDWRLGQIFYGEAGAAAFLSGDVPYIVHNDGVLASAGAHFLFEELQSSEAPREEIRVLECGPGTGLYARCFLTTFRDLCRRRNAAYFDRLTYVIADKFEHTLRDIERNELLTEFSGRYEARVLDVCDAASFDAAGAGFDVIILNYVLDCLDFAIVRAGSRPEHMEVRTRIAGAQSKDELGDAASDPVKLNHLCHRFLLETRFAPASPDVPFLERALQMGTPQAPYVVHSFGALQVLENAIASLAPGGIALISDYGDPKIASTPHIPEYQRFGGATNMLINFQELQAHAEAKGFFWHAPAQDYGSTVVRGVARSYSERRQTSFDVFFGKAAFHAAYRPLEDARAAAGQGRAHAALASYREAIAQIPTNWPAYSELGELLLGHFKAEKEALDIAAAGLGINPISCDLWNVKGDALFAAKRIQEAHECFERARAINPADARSIYNLIYTYTEAGKFDQALRIIAEAFANDAGGAWRERLVARQTELLRRITKLEEAKRRALSDRFIHTPS